MTGQSPGGGTRDTDVYLVLVGSKGTSQKLPLQGWLAALCGDIQLQTASYDDFVVEITGGYQLGDIQVTIIKLSTQKHTIIENEPYHSHSR